MVDRRFLIGIFEVFKKKVDMSIARVRKIPLNQNIQIKHKSTAFPQLLKPIIVHTDEFIEIIPQEEISFFKASSNYTCITLMSGKSILASKTMGSFEKLLSKKLFIRCHQSYIVNKMQVRRIRKNPNLTICLKDENEIPVSRRLKKVVVAEILDRL